MRIKDLLAQIETLGLDPETEVVICTTESTFDEFILEVCDHEHDTGDVIDGPDSGGWGGPEHDPRPLPQPVLSLDAMTSKQRKAVTF